MTEIVAQREIAEELGVLLQTDRFLFDHSLQVALLSCVVGLAKSYDMARLYDLTVGALLFDIGMTRLPPAIVKSKLQLTSLERKELKQHTVKGFEILSRLPGVSAASAKCALLHHERYRGSGYPFGVKHNDIPEYAQIVGLADMYDALISPRHHRKAFTFGEAMEYLFAAGNYDFDLDLVQVFLRNVSMYPVSLVVKLSSGQTGVVADVEHSMSHRPIIRIVREANGAKVQRPYEIDLRNYRDLVIVQAAMEEHENA
nr:HD domain-containing phosphohydrolase [Cohnella zeiphila]